MREFDYIIIGGGCAGLSLAYELEIHEKLRNKTLAIIEPREEYKRDKTWSFWKVFNHNFEDCIKTSWDTFTINSPSQTKYVECKKTPYQTIDSGMFYEKIISKLKLNKNVYFFKDINEINQNNSIIFNSVNETKSVEGNLWQHFYGVEIETPNNFFDEEIFNLMDFACDQRNRVHFFYTLPFTKRNALIETTWISELNNDALNDYESQIDNYLSNHLNIRECKINFKEQGAIPLFRINNISSKGSILIQDLYSTRFLHEDEFLRVKRGNKLIQNFGENWNFTINMDNNVELEISKLLEKNNLIPLENYICGKNSTKSKNPFYAISLSQV